MFTLTARNSLPTRWKCREGRSAGGRSRLPLLSDGVKSTGQWIPFQFGTTEESTSIRVSSTAFLERSR